MTRWACFASLLLLAAPARAQDPPPRIGPFVLDLHGTVPRFPDTQELADSRGMLASELPGRGWGMQVGATVYPLRLKAVTFGIGAEVTRSLARRTPTAAQAATLRASEEQLRGFASQLSFNFGTGHGWSYISAGVGQSKWRVVPEGRPAFPTDSERLKTLNYGGGARWFAKSHLAFSLDVRFYALNPGSVYLDFPHSPRTTLLVIGAGISVK